MRSGLILGGQKTHRWVGARFMGVIVEDSRGANVLGSDQQRNRRQRWRSLRLLVAAVERGGNDDMAIGLVRLNCLVALAVFRPSGF